MAERRKGKNGFHFIAANGRDLVKVLACREGCGWLELSLPALKERLIRVSYQFAHMCPKRGKKQADPEGYQQSNFKTMESSYLSHSIYFFFCSIIVRCVT